MSSSSRIKKEFGLSSLGIVNDAIKAIGLDKEIINEGKLPDEIEYFIQDKDVPRLKTAIAEAGLEAIEEAKKRVSHPILLKREIDAIIKLYNINDIFSENGEIATVENLTKTAKLIVIENKPRESIFIEAKKES